MFIKVAMIGHNIKKGIQTGAVSHGDDWPKKRECFHFQMSFIMFFVSSVVISFLSMLFSLLSRCDLHTITDASTRLQTAYTRYGRCHRCRRADVWSVRLIFTNTHQNSIQAKLERKSQHFYFFIFLKINHREMEGVTTQQIFLL